MRCNKEGRKEGIKKGSKEGRKEERRSRAKKKVLAIFRNDNKYQNYL